jgi:hypothetical protein
LRTLGRIIHGIIHVDMRLGKFLQIGVKIHVGLDPPFIDKADDRLKQREFFQ